MIPEAALVVLAGAFAGGIVSGLTGFGTGITALPVRLTAISLVLAGPLGTILGAWLGRRIYNRFDDTGFEKAVLGLLMLSGLLLVASAIHSSLGVTS